MICFPNCKINIGLFITGKRQDGYHNLETVFYPVPVNDVLEIIPSTETRFHLSGIDIPGNTDENIVLKAYKLMVEHFQGKIPYFDIYLHKVIPTGAGLGGGSADGAFMLQLLNNFCKLNKGKSNLAELALQLGSDCPFFIYNQPQFAQGRGEVFEDIEINLKSYSLQLILPHISVSTSKAFKLIQPAPSSFDLRQLGKLPVEQWKECVRNDFETPIFKAEPVLQEIKEQLYDAGAIYASMSGSGSAIYAIMPKGKKAILNVGIGIKEFFVE